jgi:hypothetical protein
MMDLWTKPTTSVHGLARRYFLARGKRAPLDLIWTVQILAQPLVNRAAAAPSRADDASRPIRNQLRGSALSPSQPAM